MATIDRPQISLRPATPSDLPEITSLDMSAHSTHPMTGLAWAHPSDAHAVLLARYTLLFSLPFYHFLVAVQPLPLSPPLSQTPQSEKETDQILGFAMWKEGGEEKEEPDFQPEIPETANLKLISWFLAESQKTKESLEKEIKGAAFLDAVAVRPDAQRRGVGGVLLRGVVGEVDKRGERMYLKSSKAGKGLYEKFGWRCIGEHGEKGVTTDLKDFGFEHGYTNWDMMREVGGAL
ncbi:acyl-CoA N-acyltransferase [Hyaloscypha variabilis]